MTKTPEAVLEYKRKKDYERYLHRCEKSRYENLYLINHEVEKKDPVYIFLEKDIAGYIPHVFNTHRASRPLALIKNRRMKKEDYLCSYEVHIGKPDIEMVGGVQWDPKVSNPIEERPKLLYLDAEHYRTEMRKLAERFSRQEVDEL